MRVHNVSIFSRSVSVFILAVLISSFVYVTPVLAAGIVVNSNADTVADDGSCTLREAIDSAVSDLPSGVEPGECAAGDAGTDTIGFADNYTITVGDQLPLITTAIAITGMGAANTIIQADISSSTAQWRVFQVAATGNLTLDQLTIRHGSCAGLCSDVGGANPEFGGGIYNDGTVTLTNTTIASNAAGGGGGIYNTGTLTLTNSIFTDNEAVAGRGGGIYSIGTLTVTSSTFSENRADTEAGIYSTGTLTVTDSTFSANHAFTGTGAIGIEGSSATGTVTNSTFIENLVDDGEGAGIRSSGDLIVINSTFFGNKAWVGGAIANFNTLTVTNSTISGNTTINNQGDGIFNDSTFGISVLLQNTIVANNGGENCFGTVTNGGYNLDSGDTCGWDSDAGSRSNTDPLLGALADNGGPTQTIALELGSPAIDAGNDAVCPSADQRGASRPQGSHCDIGAYEQEIQSLSSGWVGGVKVEADRNIAVLARPHIGAEVTSYDGFSGGSLSAYVPMLFKNAYGSYNSALYVQNVDASNTAHVTIQYYDNTGLLQCTKADTITPLSSTGYWMSSATCDTGLLPDGWVGSAVITSDQPVVTVGRPHIGEEVMTYDGFPSGSLNAFLPMLFNQAYDGSYNAAFYIQNVHATNPASLTFKYYDSAGTLVCTKADTIQPLASKGYWIPTVTCDTGSLPVGWVGGLVVTSDQPIVSVGRLHIGTQVTTYDGFTTGNLSSYFPMLFKQGYGSYDSAFYIQNTDTSNSANITIQYYDSEGTLNCTKSDTLASLASIGYWVPAATCDTGSLPDGWVGGVVVTSDRPIVGVGRSHLGPQITTYNGFATGSLNSYLPMLFKGAFDGTYDSAFYVQNTENSSASVTVKFYDASGNLTCTRTDTIAALAVQGYWVPSVICNP
jgi:CSLREA domain-containing protein